ncbi:recombinase family protein [Streptomyces sp. PmtG]
MTRLAQRLFAPSVAIAVLGTVSATLGVLLDRYDAFRLGVVALVAVIPVLCYCLTHRATQASDYQLAETHSAGYRLALLHVSMGLLGLPGGTAGRRRGRRGGRHARNRHTPKRRPPRQRATDPVARRRRGRQQESGMTPAEIPATFHGSLALGEPWLAYIRVSTWREEKISPELQRNAIEAWAASVGVRIIDWMIDLDESGRHFKRKITKCVERVESGEAKGVAVWRYSRFGRNRTGNAAWLARLEAAGGRLESATERVDARTAVGELQREMIFAFGNFESNRASEQWKETHTYRVQNLKLPATGRPRFGYIWHPRKVPDPTTVTGWRLQQERYTLHPELAEVVEEMYDRKTDDHDGFNQLAHWLNEVLAIPTTRGKAWGTSSVQRFLDSGFAAGLLRIHDPECPCPYSLGEISRCKFDRMLYVPGAQPRIILPGQWEAYRAHRAEWKKRPPRARKATYRLTGLMWHGICRFHASISSGSTSKGEQIRGKWYVCSRHKHANRIDCPKGIHVAREQVETDVKAWLRREIVGDVDALETTPGQQEEKTEDPKERKKRERAHLQRELTRIEAALDRLVEENALDPDKYPGDSFARVRDKLLGRKGSLVAELNKLGNAPAEEMPKREDFRPIVVGLLDEWDLLTMIEANALLSQVIRRVVLYDERDEDGNVIKVRTVIHPTFEPDPWERKKVCRGPFGTRADWLPDFLWERPTEAAVEADVDQALDAGPATLALTR